MVWYYGTSGIMAGNALVTAQSTGAYSLVLRAQRGSHRIRNRDCHIPLTAVPAGG